MRIPFLPIALVLLGASAFAHGEDSPWYAQFSVGGVFSDTAESVPGSPVDFDPGYEVSLALGRHFPYSERFGLDVELEGYYQYFKVDEDDLPNISSAISDDDSALAWMLNGLFEWHFTPQFAFYGGGGAGYATSAKYEAWDSGNLKQEDKEGFAYQGKAGFTYDLGGNYDLLLGYRYFRIEPLDIQNQVTGETDQIDIGQHVVEVAFRWGL